MARSLAFVDRAIKDAVSPSLSLYRGDGYHYLIFDDLDHGGSYASHSVMVPRLSDLSVADWISTARDFVADID